MEEPQQSANKPDVSGPPLVKDVAPSDSKNVPEVPEAIKETMTSASPVAAAPLGTTIVDEPPADGGSTPALTEAVEPEAAVAVKSSATKASGGSRTARIAVALIVALLLIGAAIYIYVSSPDEPTANTTRNDAAADTSQAVSTSPATAEDVDQTVSDIDSALTAADAAQDVSSSDLTDSALGL